MLTRRWFALVGAFLQRHFLLAQDQAVFNAVRTRVFTIPRVSEHKSQIQDVVAYEGDLIYLHGPTSSNDMSVTRVTAAGAMTWNHQLPRGHYGSLTVGSGGRLYVYKIDGLKGSPLFGVYSVDISSGAAVLSRVGTVSGTVGSAEEVVLLGESLITKTAAATGHLEVYSRVGETLRAVIAVPDVIAPAVHLLANGTIVIVDRMRGDLISLIGSDTRKPVRLNGVTGIDATQQRPNALVVVASGVVTDKLFMLTPPFRTNNTATLLELNSTGSVVRKVTVHLPSLPEVPMKLLPVGREEVGVVFADGTVNAFSI